MLPAACLRARLCIRNTLQSRDRQGAAGNVTPSNYFTASHGRGSVARPETEPRWRASGWKGCWIDDAVLGAASGSGTTEGEEVGVGFVVGATLGTAVGTTVIEGEATGAAATPIAVTAFEP